MAHLRTHWLAYLLGMTVLLIVLYALVLKKGTKAERPHPTLLPGAPADSNQNEPSEQALIIYGKKLIDSTAKFLGPRGSIASISNGLNCENCHRESGTKINTYNFFAVASTYPKYRPRSGRIESVEFRINECMQRSLNGHPLDSMSREMRAMVAYIKGMGKHLSPRKNPAAFRSTELQFLPRAADARRGGQIYAIKCRSCHGENGEGVFSLDSVFYVYPPVWGKQSYAVSAGMFRLSKLASFIKYNMPLGATYLAPMLNDEESWDLAAYINSKPHPARMFAYDWPLLETKPVDYPFGPFSDSFSEQQHKFGPFADIVKAKEKAANR